MRRSLGSFVLSAAVITAGFYLLAHAIMLADVERFQSERAMIWARALARAAEHDLGEDTKLAGGMLTALKSQGASALVLEGTKFLAHSEAHKAGARLDRDSLVDKALFDAAKSMKADVKKNAEERGRKPGLERDPFPPSRSQLTEDETRWEARAPVVVDGRYKAYAQVTVPHEDVPTPFPLVLAFIAAFGVLTFLPIAWKVEGLGAAFAGAGLLVIMLLTQFTQVQGWRGQLRKDRADRIARSVADLGAPNLLRATSDDGLDGFRDDLNQDAAGRATERFVGVRSSTLSAPRFEDARPFESNGVELGTNLTFLARRAAAQEQTLFRWGLVIALFGAGLFVLGITGRLEGGANYVWRHRSAYFYMTPAMLGMAVLVFIPVSYGLSLGFQARVYNEYQFVGLQNYTEILTSGNVQDPRSFYFTLGVTVLWTVTNTFLHVTIGLFLALLLNDQMLKAKGIYRVILVVPWAIPNYITALIWKSMFHKQFGAVNAFLETFGVEGLSWFQTFWPAFSTNVATNTWLGFPFMMVVSLGALQSIPTDLYEAARVDGASRWQRFYNITLPLLMPALVPAVIVGTVWTFNMFNIIYLVSGGAPDGATDILITEAYRWGFENDRKGFAAAYSTVIFLILLVFTVVTNRITGATKGAYE